MDQTSAYDSELAALQRKQRLAALLMQQGYEGSPILSPWQGVARVAAAIMGNMQSGEADRGERDLAQRRSSERQAEMDRILTASSGNDRTQLARLLARSSDPTLQQAGLAMALKGPGKLEYHDAGDRVIVTDETGNTVREIPKGVTADTKFNATTVPASTAFTQGKEDERQMRTLSTVPASVAFTQGREDVRQGRSLAQSESHFQRTQAQPQIIQGPNGEVFAVNKNTASGAPVTGPDGQPLNKGEKALTETQGNAVAFGMRAKASNDIINDLEAHGAPLDSVTGLLAKNRATNLMAPEWAQKAQQAKINFMSATLRKESGAAISQSEYDAEDRKYFPQPGDAPAVIEQKRRARDLAIDTLRAQAGSGSKKIDGASAGGAVRISSDAEYNALPSGAEFVGPDGKRRRKP